jgi:hypothetical protein
LSKSPGRAAPGGAASRTIRGISGNSPAPPAPNPPQTRPHWLSYVIVALAAILIFSRFWFGVGDPDFWWHLKTGQYIWQNHKLPLPDPFAYTTYMHGDSYPGESLVRYFNLTHEWLAQLAFYGAYSLDGAIGVAALRALLLTLTCGALGLVAWRRTGAFYRSVVVALAAMACIAAIASERPYLFSFFLLTAVVAILEYRRWLWALPPIFLVWANCHGGFFLGWIALGAYCAEALAQRWRGTPAADERQLLLCAVLSVLASGVNPNGFNVIVTLFAYRRSPQQTSILEWQRPKYWELSTFTVVLYASLAALLWARRRARVSDWILYLLFAAAAVSAVRNVVLAEIIGLIVLASYPPFIGLARFFKWKRALPAVVGYAAALLLAARIATAPHPGFNSGDWRFSAGAADFLLAHRITGRLFNSYESGGYLIWRLWPRNQVFIDGRALSETAFADYRRIAFNADSTGGRSGEDLLRRYNIGVVAMPMIDYSGTVYLLPAALSDPSQREWKLVYADPQAVIYMKTPPEGVTPLPPATALTAMEAQCNLMLDLAGDDCARGVASLYGKIGDSARAAQWMAVYRDHGGAANARIEFR